MLWQNKHVFKTAESLKENETFFFLGCMDNMFYKRIKYIYSKGTLCECDC